MHYAPSTKFYLADKRAGKPWITRLPFPVHVVERVETYDRISGNRFVTRYAYHHGYFDGVEREFRGFGMVEQWDTEEFAALNASGSCPPATNIDAASHVPPVLTKTWFHTGVYLGRDHISDFFAGLLDDNDVGEYYREPGLTDDAGAGSCCSTTPCCPPGLTRRGRARSLPRAEGLDAAPGGLRAGRHRQGSSTPTPSPSRTSRSSCCSRAAATATRCSSPMPARRISYHYERNPADPRIGHALTLEVDDFGNVLQVRRHRLRPAPAGSRRCPPADQAQADADCSSPTPRTASPTRSTQRRRLPHAAAVRDAHLRADRLAPARRGAHPLRRFDERWLAPLDDGRARSPTSRRPTAARCRSA